MPIKNILILFPSPHIAYSPTTLGIYDALSKTCNVTIYAPQPKGFEVSSMANRNIVYFNFNTNRFKKVLALPAFFFNKIKRLFNKSFAIGKLSIYEFVCFNNFKNSLQQIAFKNYDEVIAVDLMMLYLSSFYCKKVSFLSLELTDNEKNFLKLLPNNFFKAIVIQTKIRYDYLFAVDKENLFLLQNSPIYKPLLAKKTIENTIIFNGTATAWFGLYHSLNFVKKYPQFTIVFKGAVPLNDLKLIITNYKSLVDNGNIIINKEYMESNDMLSFMSQYEVGFCFYDLSYPHINTFNYKTAPSGKMFAYLAAGVPIVGINIEGLKVIEDFEAGILINNFEPSTILAAINKIKSNYNFYKNNCAKAAAFYSFDKNVAPFVHFLEND